MAADRIPRPLLSKAAAAAAQAEEKRYELRHKTVSGLRLIVQPSGLKSWAVRYMKAGRDRRLILGSYPTISLNDAVQLASAAKRDVALGGDPAAARVEARRLADAAANEGTSFVASWEAYCIAPKIKSRDGKQWRKASRGAADRLFRRIEPLWGKKSLDEIHDQDVSEFLDRIAAVHPQAASRTLAVLSSFFNWCVTKKKLSESPCKGIERYKKPTKRRRKLSDDEIRWLWRACEKQSFPMGYIVRLLILTIARRTEVSGLCLGELHLGTQRSWMIPASRTKNNREHKIFLTDQMVDIINSIPKMRNDKSKPAYLFTTNGKTSFSGFSKAKHQLDSAMLEIAKAEDSELTLIPNWTLHDLRRTGATRMQRLGFDDETVEACLNHFEEDSYLQDDREPKMKEAFQAWSREVLRIISPNTDQNSRLSQNSTAPQIEF